MQSTLAKIARGIKLLLLVLVAALFLTFSIVNRETVTVSLFPLSYTADMPKFLLALICFALGAIVAGLLMSLRLAKRHKAFVTAQKRAAALENEVKGLREQSNIPAETSYPRIAER